MMWSLGRALTGRLSAVGSRELRLWALGSRLSAEAETGTTRTEERPPANPTSLRPHWPRAESREPRACRPSLRPFLRHVALLLALASSPAAAQERLLDSFDSTAAWTAAPSDGVALRLAADSGYRGRGLRMD